MGIPFWTADVKRKSAARMDRLLEPCRRQILSALSVLKHPSDKWSSWPTLFCSVVAVGLALVLSDPSLVSGQPAKSGAVIACFHKKTGRFTAQAHPSRCNIAGYHGRDREFVEVPVKGVNWGHWGFNPTRGAYGRDKRNGKGVQIIAYRPIACEEGRRWYSQVVIVFPGEGTFFGLRLPTCDDPAVIG